MSDEDKLVKLMGLCLIALLCYWVAYIGTLLGLWVYYALK